MKGHVYILYSPGNRLYKIGETNCIDTRIRDGNTWLPYGLKVVSSYQFPNKQAAQAVEGMLHKRYESQNVVREWFDLELRHLQEIESIANMDGTFNSFKLIWLWFRDLRLKLSGWLGSRQVASKGYE